MTRHKVVSFIAGWIAFVLLVCLSATFLVLVVNAIAILGKLAEAILIGLGLWR